MAIRWSITNIKDIADSAWTIEIHDSDYVGSTQEIEIAYNSPQIKYEGNPNKAYHPITPSTFSATLFVENATHATLITDLLQSPEDEFTVKVIRGSTMYWSGRLIVDKISIKDEDYPYIFQIRAVCGLAMLKDVEYNNSGTAYTGQASILEHIQNCLGKIGTDSFWSVTDDYLITGVNWFEDSHSSPDDPLESTRVAHEVFYEIRDDGQKDHLSCYDVLSKCLTAFGANIRLSAGVFYVNQLTEYANSTQRRISYYKSGLQKLVTASQSYDVSVDQTRTDAAGSGRWRTNGRFTSLPQLRAVRLIYDNKIPSNILLNATWNHVTGSNPVSAGSISAGSGDVALKFTGTLNVTMNVDAQSDIIHIHRFQFQIKVGSYYLRRDAQWTSNYVDASYYGATWTTDESYFEWWTNKINPDNYISGAGIHNEYNIDIPIEFITPDLLGDGSVTIDFFRVDTYDGTTEDSLDFTALNMTYTLFNTSLSPEGAGSGEYVTQSVTYESLNPDTDNNTLIDTYKTIIGDGPNDAYPGHLEVYNGSSWESSNAWQLAGSGTSYEIGQLFVRELMALQRIPRKIYDGEIIGQGQPSAVAPPAAHERVEIQSGEYYHLMTGTLTLDEWRWKGSYLLVDKNIVGVTVEDTILATADLPIIGGPGSGGSGPPVVVGPPQSNQQVPGNSFTTGYAVSGFTAYLPLSSINLLPGQINEGDTATIIHPTSGVSHSFTIAADHPGGSAPIAAFTQLPNTFPSNSILQVSQPQTTSGLQSTPDTVQQVFEEDAASITDADFLALSQSELFTDQNAGNGSTAGLVIDSEGVKQYNASSSTPIGHIYADGSYSTFKVLDFQNITSEETKAANRFYIYKGNYPVLADTIATRPIKPVTKEFHCVDYNTNVTAAVLGEFFPIGTEWSSYKWGRYKVVCQSYGSGTGNNQIRFYLNGVTQITAGFTIPLWTSIPIPIALTLNDVLHWEVLSVRSTAPKGLRIELELII